MRDLINRLNSGTLAYDFVGRRRRWYLISSIVIAISLLALLIRGLTLGIEFKGGADFQAPVQVTSSTVDDFKQAVTDSGVPDLDGTTVTTIGSNTVRIQTRTLSVDEVASVRSAIAEKAGVGSDQVAYSLIGASWGQQITQKGIIALVVFLVLVMLVIWAYFRDWKMSVAAVLALLHDLIVTVGVYALVGFTVTPASLIGVLTILGYSLYDTVVVFDKVRENVRDLTNSSKRTYSEAANAALNQVMVRSLATTIIGVLPVAALLFAGVVVLGQGPLEDLSLALFVGMVAGAYSSIFLATVLLAQMKEREPALIKHRERVERRRAGETRRRRGDVPADSGDGARTGSSRRAARGATSTAVLEREGARADRVLDDEDVSEPSNAELAAQDARTDNAATTDDAASDDAEPGARRARRTGGVSPRIEVTTDRPGTIMGSGAAKRPQPRNTPRSQRRKR